MSAHDQGSLARRLYAARAIVVLALLTTLVIARGLFLEHALFGAVPAFPGAPSWGAPVDVVLLGLIGAAGLAALHPRGGLAALVCVGLLALRCVPDRMAWQPYLLHYGFALLALGLAARPQADPGRALRALRWCAAGIYFWSGASKFTATFLDNGMEQLLPAVVPESWVPGLQSCAIVVPLSEVAFALGLLLPRLRRPAVVLAIATHLFILAMIGPTGLSYNHVVWPWNLAMLLLVPLLFWSADESESEAQGGSGGLVPAALGLFWVAPILGHLGLWNPYLSFKLYTVNFEIGTIYVSPALAAKLPETTQANLQPLAIQREVEGRAYEFAGFLVVPWWSEAELSAFAPPSEAIYVHVLRRLRELADSDRDLLLLIDGIPAWDSTERSTRAVHVDQL